MPATSRHTAVSAAKTLLLLAMAATGVNGALKEMTYEGCFSSSQPLKNQGSYTYQTSGYCQPICVGQNHAVLATSNGDSCWCGDELPSASSKVDDSKCNTPCDGYDSENCGGNGYWSVYLSGTENSVPNYDGPSDDPSQTTATPSVITSISPGRTIVVTETPSSATGGGSKSGSGPNVAGIAGGVVVGVVLVSGAVAGVFFWLRHKRKQAAEEEYKRNQVADFMRNGKPPQTAYSQASDSRLDPELGNGRNSLGSIADAQDYSRKILRVANPDQR